MISRLRSWAPAAVLAAAVGALYAVTVGFGYLRFDDPDYTFACPFVREGLTWSGVKTAFAQARYAAIWMPLTWLSYMADIAVGGPGPGPHHVVNVLLHIANTLLLARLAQVLAPAPQPGARQAFVWGLVAFWALHPQRVEAVAWIAARKELLWTFWTLLGLLAWRRARVLPAVLCCALACLCKPTALVFPALAFLVAPPRTDATPCRRAAAYIPLGLCALATGALALYSQTHPAGMAVKELYYASFGVRLLNAVVAVGLVLGQMVLPLGLHLDYRAASGVWPVDGAAGLVLFAAAGVAAVWAARRFGVRRVGWGLAWFFVALAPTLGLAASFGEHARADRFLYVPAMALVLAVARAGGGAVRRATLVACAVYVAGVAALAVPLVWSYRSDEAAFARTLACDPDHGRALAHVGEARCAAAFDPARPGAARAAALDEGIAFLRRSRAVRPRAATDGKLAYALMKRGRAADWDEIRAVCAPFAADPARDVKGQALEALGTAELRARAWSAAAAHLAASIRAPGRFYSSDDARLKLAFALHNGGQRAVARKLFADLAHASRADIAARAAEAGALLEQSPAALLFW